MKLPITQVQMPKQNKLSLTTPLLPQKCSNGVKKQKNPAVAT
jgi:hypothetical protein